MNVIGTVFNPKEFTGWHMVGVMGLFFGTIISVNLFLAFSAGSTWTGLVVKNTYVESQKFNRRTAERESQLKLKWQAQAIHENNGVSVSLTDAEGQAINAMVVSGMVGRPVHENDDQVLNFDLQPDGKYFSNAKLAPGEWVMDLNVIGQQGEIWNRSFRIDVKG